MVYKFTDSRLYPYKPGTFFLGLGDDGREVGISTERHLLTIAGAGGGKGATLIVPNLRRWRGSALVVDPKGENATITAGDREAMGQLVGVVDPYHIAKDRAAALRCSINPLSMMRPESLTIRADLEALGDGLIRRFDPKHAQWDNSAATICAGVADYVLATCTPEERNLLSVRSLLLTPDEDLKIVAQQMAETPTRAKLARQAGVLILNKFANAEGVPASAFNRAIEETGWIDDEAFEAVLGGGDLPPFDLATLKAGTGSLYLCIKPGHLDTRGGFLRLFVRMGLMTMMEDLAEHESSEGRCLFLLDEFHSLGKIELVAKAAGLMRGFGVQLWPFLQDLGQLATLYGDDEMHTFFANADAHIFFANADTPTLNHVSETIGHLEPHEIGAAPIARRTRAPTGATARNIIGGSDDYARIAGGIVGGGIGAAGGLLDAMADHANQKAANDYQAKAQGLGKPRVSPSEIRELVGKKEGDKIARAAIVFAKGGDVLKIRLAPYFAVSPTTTAPAAPDPVPEAELPAKREPNKAMMLIGCIAMASGFLPLLMRDDVGAFGGTIYLFTTACGALALLMGRFARG